MVKKKIINNHLKGKPRYLKIELIVIAVLELRPFKHFQLKTLKHEKYLRASETENTSESQNQNKTYQEPLNLQVLSIVRNPKNALINLCCINASSMNIVLSSCKTQA